MPPAPPVAWIGMYSRFSAKISREVSPFITGCGIIAHMDIDALTEKIKTGDDNAIREMILSRGTEVFRHAMALCGADKTAARAVTAEAFRGVVAYIRAFPEEKMDEQAFSARIDSELLEAVMRQGEQTVAGIISEDHAQASSSLNGQEAPRQPAYARKKKRLPFALEILLLWLCIGLSLWLLYGILASMGFVPYMDLGYTWFNRNLFQVF